MLETVIAVLMIVMAVGIAGVWTADIVRGTRVDLSRGILRARDDGAGCCCRIGSPSTAPRRDC